MRRYVGSWIGPLLLLFRQNQVQAWGLIDHSSRVVGYSRLPLKIFSKEDDNDFSHSAQRNAIRLLLEKVLAKMRVVQQDTVDSSFFGSSSSTLLLLRKQMKSTIEVRESSIPGAGLGIFARQNIKAGTIVSFYPVHCLGVDYAETTLRFFLSADDELHMTKPPNTGQPYLQFLLGSRPLLGTNVEEMFGGNPLFVDANPARVNTDTSCFLAHLVNDGSTVLESSDQGLVDYYSSSKERKNCVFIPFGPAPLIALVTTRKVKRHQELFTSYGANYWMEQEENNEEEEVSDSVLELVRESAKEILTCMQSARTTYSNQLDALTVAWDAIESP